MKIQRVQIKNIFKIPEDTFEYKNHSTSINILTQNILHPCHVLGIISRRSDPNTQIHKIWNKSWKTLPAPDLIESNNFKLNTRDANIIENGTKNKNSFFATFKSNSWNIQIINNNIQSQNTFVSFVLL
jgi:hypothetical protein